MSNLNPEVRSETAHKLDVLAEELFATIAKDELPFPAQQKLQTAATLVLGAANLIDAEEFKKLRGEF